MHKYRWISLLIVLLMLGGSVTNALAQDYRFQVEQIDAEVFVNEDGSLSIDYTYVFKNDPSGHPIDYVDIGLPNDNFVLSSVSADVDGKPITDIQRSDYVQYGVALGLKENTIQPGQKGTVHVLIGTLNKSIYPSDLKENEPYVSFEFSPHWYDSATVYGNTDTMVTLYLPVGMNSDEPRYHVPVNWSGNEQPETGFDKAGGIFYRWQNSNANAYTQYTFGASFPAKYVPESAVVTAPAITFDTNTICPIVICLGFVIFFGLTIYGATVGAKKRKLQYLPPKISIEGMGIKRGLTAVEAAILMEQPLDKVLTMILFSCLKKDVAEVITRDPLNIKVEDTLPEGLQQYEIEFLDAFKVENKNGRQKKLQAMMVNLVNSLTLKMKGFSRKETVEYYKSIMERAWEQVEAAGTPEVRSQAYEQNLDWTMLDKRFDERTQETLSRGPVFVPVWWWRYDPGMRPAMATGRSTSTPVSTAGPARSGTTTVNLPNLPGSTFAASVVGGIQSFSSGVVGDITKFTDSITNKTNPVPPPSSSSSRSIGRGGGSSGVGHSCACACACAGCACACAGGGR